MTRIGLDLAYLEPGGTGGMETYARALIPRMAARRPDLTWTAFCGRELAGELRASPWVPEMGIVELPVSSGARFRRVAIEQTLEAWRIRRAGVSLVHSLGNTAPLAPLGAPLVVTVHDLIWARHPETHSGLLARGLAFLVPRAVRRADAVVVPSQATRDDVVRLLGAPAGKLDVVVEGPGLPGGVPATPMPELRRRLGLGELPIVLCPAPKRPHKNIPRLARALSSLDVTLVVPGYEAVGHDAELAAARAAGARVVLPGWVSESDLEGLYAGATCLAYPSLAEGFGLPVLEAMVRGLPVACADATSLPEVAGDAALLFDPLDETSIRAAVERLVSEPDLRGRLAARGRERASAFTWDACAAGTLAVYDRLLA